MSGLQGSLFPDGAEVRDRVVAALDDLRLVEGWARVEEARAQQGDLTGLEALEHALAWLGEEFADQSVDVEVASRAWLALSRARFERRLTRAAADLVDETLARYLLARAPVRAAFVDRARRVHRGALHLVLGRSHTAHAALLDLVSLPQVRVRADLSAWLGDACLREGRSEDALANYVRALVLDPEVVDFGRMAHVELRGLLVDLARVCGAEVARAGLFARAWIDGLLPVAPDNDWVGEAQVSALLAATTADTPNARARRFGLLLYRDRSRPAGSWSEAERAEMLALDPELYADFRGACARRERALTGSLDW